MNKITPINLEDESAEHCSIKQAAHHSALTPDSFAESAKGKTGFYRIIKAAGYSITVGKRDSSGDITNTDDFYHFTVDTNTATSGGVSGGGNSCSAGPATLTA